MKKNWRKKKHTNVTKQCEKQRHKNRNHAKKTLKTTQMSENNTKSND